MAFLPTSRYAALDVVEVIASDGRRASIVKLRRLPPTGGDPYVVAAHDRLDVIAHAIYGNSTESWHVADANTEIDARQLIEVARVIRVPER